MFRLRTIASAALAVALAMSAALIFLVPGCRNERAVVADPRPADQPPELLPPSLVGASPQAIGDFMNLLAEVLARPELVVLVDKRHALPADFVPPDLVDLAGLGVPVTRSGLSLRREAAKALAEMSAAASRAGVPLKAASTFRSYEYQGFVHERIVRQMGQASADRVSARPGHSQHQLGTAVDFAPISDGFIGTPADIWLREHAWQFGFSLSYPENAEALTGYRHESWHYRYIGQAAARMEREYFAGSQQLMLEWLHELGTQEGGVKAAQ